MFEQQVFAEEFSIVLYYCLCSGVVLELLDGKVARWLGSDFLDVSFLVKYLPQWLLSWWQEYGREMVLIAVMGVLVYLVWTGILADSSSLGAGIFAVMLLILLFWGKEFKSDLLRLAQW